MRYVGEPTAPQRRTKNRAPRNPSDSGHVDDMPPPPSYDTAQSAGKKSRKPKKAPAGAAAAAAAAREDDQRNVCDAVVRNVHSVQETTRPKWFTNIL